MIPVVIPFMAHRQAEVVACNPGVIGGYLVRSRRARLRHRVFGLCISAA